MTIISFIQGFTTMAAPKTPLTDLFPASFDPTILSWVLMVGIPLAMLFLVLDKWQEQLVPVPIPIEHNRTIEYKN